MENSLKLGKFLLRYCWKALLVCAVFLACATTTPLLDLPASLTGPLRQVIAICIIASVCWLCIRLMNGFEACVFERYDMTSKDNLKARKVHTQLGVIKKIVIVIILLIGFCAVLMLFERLRQLGMSLLASAGIAGIIIGFAAQRSISTLFAGLQIAITQPIRIDDVVIVENEWGRIEEITLTYVVVRIWDLRRLVLPITYFTERPFQNWTRVSADILGTVIIHLDYTASVRAIREKFFEILDQSDLWDGKVRNVQVINATERAMEIRALMSAPDASKAWELRCEVREKLIDFIQQRYPDSLPKVRGEIMGDKPGQYP
jgi:small-conductance mechanosensitive channel